MHFVTLLTVISAVLSLVDSKPQSYNIPCCDVNTGTLPLYDYGYYGYPAYTNPGVGWAGYGYGYGYGYGQCPSIKDEDCTEFYSARLCVSGSQCGSDEACCPSSCAGGKICKTIVSRTSNLANAVCPTIFSCTKWEEAHKGKNWVECKEDGDCKSKERCCMNPCESKKLCQVL